MTGPALGLIYMRPIGSDLSYGRYTEGMLHSNLYWSSINLFRFIKRPSEFIAGTKCNFIKGGLESE